MPRGTRTVLTGAQFPQLCLRRLLLSIKCGLKLLWYHPWLGHSRTWFHSYGHTTYRSETRPWLTIEKDFLNTGANSGVCTIVTKAKPSSCLISKDRVPLWKLYHLRQPISIRKENGELNWPIRLCFPGCPFPTLWFCSSPSLAQAFHSSPSLASIKSIKSPSCLVISFCLQSANQSVSE